MNNEQLRTYITVCEYGSFTKAASQLFISSVAVAKQMNSLEEEFSTTFFHRGMNGCVLTKQGKYFLDKAREIMEIYDDISQHVTQKSKKFNTLRIGYDEKVGTEFLITLTDYLSEHLGIEIELIKEDYYDYFRSVEDKQFDIAFVDEVSNEMPKSLCFEKIVKTNYYALVHKAKSDLFDKRAIREIDLKDVNVFVTPLRYSRTYDLFLKNVGTKHIYSSSLEDFLLSKKNGVYITTGLTRKIDDNYRLVPIEGMQSEWGIVYRKEDKNIIKAVISELKEFYNQTYR